MQKDLARIPRLLWYSGLLFVLTAFLTIITSFTVLMGWTPLAPTPAVVRFLLTLNGAFVLILLGLVGGDIYRIWRNRRRAAAQLHVRIVGLFSVMAVIPAALVAVVASITLHQGLDRWFQERTRNIVGNALMVAQAYVEEHARVLRGDLISMATDLDRARGLYDHEPTRFDQFFTAQASLRLIPAAFLLNSEGKVVMRTHFLPRTLERGEGFLTTKRDPLMPPPKALEEAREEKGEPIMIAPGTSNQVGGVIRLSAYDDLYLYITRAMDQRVITYLRLAEEGAQEYRELEASRFGVQLAFALVYIGVALVLLLGAIWIGFGLASALVAPIRQLIGAAQAIAQGDLRVAMATEGWGSDLRALGESFNSMTSQLARQRDELLSAKEQIDQRRRFTEAVLAGVTSGVIGVDTRGRITLVNSAAKKLLREEEDSRLLNQPLAKVLPEIEKLSDFQSAEFWKGDREQSQITLQRSEDECVVTVRVTHEESGHGEHSCVVTLDDVTDLMRAQRSAAWADVARRIAHEIKNPLTPIQLSAERLRRRYGKQSVDTQDVFEQCIETIIRQVDDIRRMVDSFSSFARMPKPVMQEQDLSETVREATFLQRMAYPGIIFKLELPPDPVLVYFDNRLLFQALTNILKNACESVTARILKEKESKNLIIPGNIIVSLSLEGRFAKIEVVDNGVGLPQENRQRLLEPYVTTRKKGTGLGLAIVQKIMEEHGGRIELLTLPASLEEGYVQDSGALVRLLFARDQECSRV